MSHVDSLDDDTKQLLKDIESQGTQSDDSSESDNSKKDTKDKKEKQYKNDEYNEYEISDRDPLKNSDMDDRDW